MPGGVVEADGTVQQVYGAQGATQIATNGSGGSIAFGQILFTADEAGAHDGGIDPRLGREFRYFIYEKQPTHNGLYDGEPLDGAVKDAEGNWVYQGVTYSRQSFERIIHVYVDSKDDGSSDRLVVATVTNATLGQMVFENAYRAQTTLDLGATKVIAGRDFQEGDSFSFQVAPSERPDVPMPADADALIEPKEGSTEVVPFGAITYTQADAARPNSEGTGTGLYYYYITETPGSLGGLAYDAARYRVAVQVTDDGKGNLSASVVEVAKDADGTSGAEGFEAIAAPEQGWTFDAVQGAVAFTNVYTPAPATIELNATKRLEGKQLRDREFSFEVTAVDQAGNALDALPDGVRYDRSASWSGIPLLHL